MSARPVPGYLAEGLAGLTAAGLVAEHEDPQQCVRRVSLTGAGAARYGELGRQRRTCLPVPPPEFPQT